MSEHHDRDAGAGVRHAMRRGCAISARRFRLTMLAENVVQQAVFNKNVGSESSPTGDSAKSLEKYAASAEGGHGDRRRPRRNHAGGRLHQPGLPRFSDQWEPIDEWRLVSRMPRYTASDA